jgi:hypothetical protein
MNFSSRPEALIFIAFLASVRAVDHWAELPNQGYEKYRHQRRDRTIRRTASSETAFDFNMFGARRSH